MAELQRFDPNALPPVEQGRSDLLRDFNRDPNDPEIWQAAYDEVRQEGDTGFDDSLVSNVPAEELISFAEHVRATPSQARYALTADSASNGKTWFETLGTFSDAQIEETKRILLETASFKTGLTHPFENSLEIGVGIGMSLQPLELYSDKVVGVDNVAELLTQAKQHTTAKLIQADATNLPFADSSFDYIGTSGVAYALSHEDLAKLYQEVDRLLMPGGIYVESVGSRDARGRPDPEVVGSYQSAKALLAQMLVDYISGERRLSINVTEDERMKIINSLNLQHLNWMTTFRDGERTILRLLYTPYDERGNTPAWLGRKQYTYRPLTEAERQGFEALVAQGRAVRLWNGTYRGVPQSQWPEYHT